MNEQWKYLRLNDRRLSDLGNGFFGENLVEMDGFEMTFVTGEAGAGHGFHHHDDLDEILVFLEGACVFNISGTDISVEAGSVLFVPHGLDHRVTYTAKSRVLRIKVTSQNPASRTR
jgi:mannose-6-phosphate isomerase-like protein (cupin superfamily)